MIQYRDLLSDTICSPITAPGYSGVAVIRVSGEKSLEITKKFTNLKSEDITSHKSYLRMFVGELDKKIDQVLITYFKKDKSFTGDETIEISCHGNPLIINAIVNAYLNEGCRAAEKGEFSFRAYYNGKIDLIQAESIHQLVTTNNIEGSDSFLSQLQGRLSGEFKFVEDNLVLALSHLEASIDFVEQEIETANYQVVQEILALVKDKTEKLIDSYSVGKSLQGSFKVLLLGKTNVGKSSLFNKFVEKDRAIVTEIAGTTRDVITGQKFIGHNSVEFIDSAGLRETSDKIEKIGIEKSIEQIQKADLVLYLVDVTTPEENNLENFLPIEKTHIVFNKIDLLDSEEDILQAKDKFLKSSGLDFSNDKVSFISTLEGNSIVELILLLEKNIVQQRDHKENNLVTQARHYNHLCELNTNLKACFNLISIEESPDILSQELQLGLSEVHQLLGKEYNDEVLDKIFSQFCIGK